jgi:hypothetical protein
MSPEHPGDPAPPDELPEALRFDVRPYEAEGGCPWNGLVLLVGLSGLGSLISAWGASHVYEWGGCGCPFIGWIVFYCIFGGIAIGAGGLGVYLGKVRAPGVAIAVALLAGAFATAAFASFRCKHHLDALRQGNPAEHARLVAQHFGVRDFVAGWDFWDWVAAGVYFVVIGPGGAVVLHAAASRPFCSACNNWKADRVLGELVMSQEEAVRILTRGEIVRLTDARRPAGKACLRLTGAACPKCGPAGALDVKLRRSGSTTRTRRTSNWSRSPTSRHALAVFEAIFCDSLEDDKIQTG